MLWPTVLSRRAWYVDLPVAPAKWREKRWSRFRKLTSRQPYKVYHGKTGVVYNVTKSAVGVILYRQVGNRYIEKRINVRVEHVRHSRSRDEFIARVKENAAKKRKAKETGEHVHLKRQPAQPREARTVSGKDNKPESIAPIAYETTI
jgi:large subunit ribosomal protein L21e